MRQKTSRLFKKLEVHVEEEGTETSNSKFLK